MKKFICLALALVMCVTMLAGCGKFDMENADLSAYIKLGDVSEFTYTELCEKYEALRESLAEGVSSCNLNVGYTIDFSVKAETVDETGAVTGTVDAWTLDLVEDYDVYRNPTNFDHALVHNVAVAGTASSVARTIKVGEDFSFTMKIADDYADADLAGRDVKFTINVKKVLQAVFTETDIADRLLSFYNAVATAKETIENGDEVMIDFTGKIDGAAFDGGTAEDYVIIVGEGELLFEEQLLGHKKNDKFDVTVTFPEDYEDETLAGKEAVFTIEVESIYNDSSLIEDNTPFDNMWDLKYALRIEAYSVYALMEIVADRTELIEYPEQLLKDCEALVEDRVAREVADAVMTYAKYGEKYSKKEMREKLYPNGSDKTYIEDMSKRLAFDYMVAVATLRALDLTYTEKNYTDDLELFTEELNMAQSESYTMAEIEELYGEEVLRISFIETFVTKTLLENITGAPEIPG